MTGIIPLSNVPDQEFDILLNGQACTLRVFQRRKSVFVDLYKDAAAVILGLKCLDRQNIIPVEYMNFSGRIWFEDQDGNQNPDYTGFGTRYLLKYEN